MKNVILTSSILSLSLLLVGCGPDSYLNKTNVGALTGGAIGGAVGSQIGSGSGQTVATVVGTLVGAGLGGVIGHSMDNVDRKKLNEALETAPSNQPVKWRSQSGHTYTVIPGDFYKNKKGQMCRHFTTEAVINGKHEQVNGTACRNFDGSWSIVN